MSSLRSAAIRLGYYNTKDHLVCYHSDVTCDMTTDIYNGQGKLLSAQDDNSKMEAVEGLAKLINKLLNFIEESMQVNGW